MPNQDGRAPANPHPRGAKDVVCPGGAEHPRQSEWADVCYTNNPFRALALLAEDLISAVANPDDPKSALCQHDQVVLEIWWDGAIDKARRLATQAGIPFAVADRDLGAAERALQVCLDVLRERAQDLDVSGVLADLEGITDRLFSLGASTDPIWEEIRRLRLQGEQEPDDEPDDESSDPITFEVTVRRPDGSESPAVRLYDGDEILIGDDVIRRQLARDAEAGKECQYIDVATGEPLDLDKKVRPRMTVEEANRKAMELAAQLGEVFFLLSEREQARRIGCHHRTWKRTMLYQQARAKKRKTHHPGAGAPGSRRAIDYTPAVDAEAARDAELRRLAAEQQADAEPSPLDDAGPNPRCRKSV